MTAPTVSAARLAELIGYYDGSGPFEHPVTMVPSTLAALRELSSARQEIERLKQRAVCAIDRLEGELDTPADIWADHVREAVRWLNGDNDKFLASPSGRAR